MTIQYLNIKDSNLSPSGSFVSSYSTNSGNNTGWTIYSGAAPAGAVTYARLTRSGNLLINSTQSMIFDEVNNTKIQLTKGVFYAKFFDEVTATGASTITMRQTRTGNVIVDGMMDETQTLT